MFEVCADMELKTKSSKPLENTETDEFADISFEELLAQEKKDSFWFVVPLKCLASYIFFFPLLIKLPCFCIFLYRQKNWKSRMCTR